MEPAVREVIEKLQNKTQLNDREIKLIKQSYVMKLPTATSRDVALLEQAVMIKDYTEVNMNMMASQIIDNKNQIKILKGIIDILLDKFDFHQK